MYVSDKSRDNAAEIWTNYRQFKGDGSKAKNWITRPVKTLVLV